MLNQVMGTYIPSAFSICLNALPQNLDIKDATFVHEYIHFLQDLLLPYCIRQNLVFIDDFACVSTESLISKKLECPFNKWSDNCCLTRKQTMYTWGNGDSKVHVGSIIDIQSDYFTSRFGHNIYRYFLKFDDGTDYQFGARDLLEYLAHKIESQFWVTNAPDLPYRTVDKVFEYFSVNFIPDDVRLLILEYCLYNDNPVHMLINIFFNQEIIMKNRNQFTDYEKCTSFLLSLGWQSKGGFDETILTKTERRLNDFRERLSQLYPHRQFGDIKKWIVATNAFCKEKLSNKFIISSLYKMSKDKLHEFIEEIVNIVGIPVIIFKDASISTSLLPEHYHSEQFIEFYVIKMFMQWVCTNTKCCPMFDICSKNYGLCQEICITNPIAYSGECIFKIFLQSYCFDKLEIEY